MNEKKSKLSRRNFLRGSAVVGGLASLAYVSKGLVNLLEGRDNNLSEAPVMDSIYFEIDPGKGYELANAFIEPLYSVPIVGNLLRRPKVIFASAEFTPSRDGYQEKVSRVTEEVFNLLRGEPFHGYTEGGSAMGRGLSKLPVSMIITFSDTPSDDLVGKIRGVEGVANVKYKKQGSLFF